MAASDLYVLFGLAVLGTAGVALARERGWWWCGRGDSNPHGVATNRT
jgi:hypothetical protein